MVAIACGCVMVLVLAGGVGVGLFGLVRGMTGGGPEAGPTSGTTETESPDPEQSPTSGESSSPTATGTATQEPTSPEEEESFTPVPAYLRPEGDVEHTLGVLADNPLTEGSLPAVGSCDLPATPVDHDAEQLQALFDVAASCLSSVWSTASSDRDLDAQTTDVLVYQYPDLPESECSEENFSEDSPTTCSTEGTIYWPFGAGFGAEQTDPDLVPTTYLLDLARPFSNRTMWSSTLVVYYVHVIEQTEHTDPDLAQEAELRYSLQMDCWGAAASMQVPESARPSQEVRDLLTDARTWEERPTSVEVSPETRARWFEAGFSSGGDLGECNTWAAPVDEVT